MANTAFKAEHGLFVQGNANVAGNINVTGDFNVGGTFTSAVQATGDIKPATDGLSLGNTTFRWNLVGISLSGRDLSISNSVSVSNTLTVTGATALQSGLTVDGTTLVVDSVNNRVGVNIASPTEALDVSGTVKATALSGNLNWSFITNRPDPVITVSLTGDVAGSANAELTDLAGNTITITTAIQPNSVALGTDTTGDYVASVSGGTPGTVTSSGLTISGTGEGANVSISHSDTSSLSNTSYTDGTVLSGFTVDGFGHMLTFSTANLDSRYITTTSSFETTGTITTASPFTVKAQGAEGGEIVLKKGTAQTGLNGDAVIDTLANSVRFFENGGTFRQFNFDFSTGNITNPSSSVIWHSGNDGPSSGLDADSVDGYSPGNASGNIPLNNGTLNTNLNADQLDGQDGSFYSNASNLSTGTVPNARLSGTYGNALTLNNSGNVLTGNGSTLTSLNASQLSTGTVPSARLDGSYTSIVNITASGTITGSTLTGTGISTSTSGSTGSSRLYIDSPVGQTANPVRILVNSSDIFSISPTGAVSAAGAVTASSFSGSGANITSMNASNLSTGTVNTGRLGSGTASSSTFLRGDGTWATPPVTDISISTTSTTVTVNSSTGVDSAISGATTSQAGVMTASDKSKLDNLPSSNVMYYAGFTLDASTMPSNSTGFTYGVNAPYTGPVARFSTGGSYDLWLNAPYGSGDALAFRTKNGDSNTLNPWRGILLDTNNSSLNSDSRNTRGVTRLYRRDDNSDYSVQISWSTDKASYWSLRGYNGDSYHAGVWVAWAGNADYAASAGSAGSASSASTADLSSRANQLQSFTADDFTGGDHYVKAIRESGWTTRLKTCYNGGASQSNDVRVGYADSAGYATSAGSATSATSAGTAGYATSAGSAPANGGTSSAVTINYNNDSNSTYQMLWGSGNSVYGTSGVYLNPATDYVYAASWYATDWFRSGGATGWYSETYGGGVFMQDTTWVRIYNAKAFYVANEIAATGNITAYYSDERLKTRVGILDNALEKVNQLSGFKYINNDFAKSVGYTSDKVQVGLSAQEVEAIMPEIVSLAPFDMEADGNGGYKSKSGQDYKTVDYAKLVPLLVEAIKELTERVKELEAR